MKPIVLYSSKSGNTRKIADEIASELSCESLKITQDASSSLIDLNNYNLIFLGTGIRFGNPNEDLVSYLKKVDLKNSLLFAVFVTWGGAGQTDKAVFAKLKNMLEAKNQRVMDDYFKCYGGRKFSLLRTGHPNSEDAQAAKKWARTLANNI